MSDEMELEIYQPFKRSGTTIIPKNANDVLDIHGVTQTLGDNTTKLATTAFVLANGGGSGTSVWDRSGTNLSPHTAGDSVLMNGGIFESTGLFLDKVGVATVITPNIESGYVFFQGSYWSGSAEIIDAWTMKKIQDGVTSWLSVEDNSHQEFFVLAENTKAFGLYSRQASTEVGIEIGALNNLTNGETVLTVVNGKAGGKTDLLKVDSHGSLTTAGRTLGKSTGVASANDLTLGYANQFIVSGSVTINAITTTGWTAGSKITLIFSGAPLVKHNTAGGTNTVEMYLAGSTDFQAATNSVLTLEYDGSHWQEISRKVA